jgi:hypothetical protein
MSESESGGVETQIGEVESHIEDVFRDRFHKLDTDLQGIVSTAQNKQMSTFSARTEYLAQAFAPALAVRQPSIQTQ